MAFRATNVVPQRAYQQVKGAAANVKAECARYITQMAASGANYVLLRDLYVFLKNANTQFATLAATPGIAAYAQAQEDDDQYDVAAEFATMQAAVTAVLTWMDANVPTSVTALAPSVWTATGPLISTSFNAAQTLGLRTALQAAADSIA